MIGSSIGTQTIGGNSASYPPSAKNGIRGIYAADTQIAAVLSTAVFTGAVYSGVKGAAAHYIPTRSLHAVYASKYILFMTAGTKDDSIMFTHIHGNIETRSGETAELIFNVTDKDGNAADLAGAAAEYRIARRAGDAALLTCTSAADGGIVIDDNAVTVTLDTAALTQDEKPMLGDFFAQLRITVGGRTLVAAEGPISILPVILPAP